ncbi:MAG: hypothetical protein ACI8U4_002097, partial [Natronomonas sp.]
SMEPVAASRWRRSMADSWVGRIAFGASDRTNSSMRIGREPESIPFQWLPAEI